MREDDADQAIEIALEFAKRKVNLGEMIADLLSDRHLISGSQRARLLADMVTEPMPDQVERLIIKDATIKFLEQCAYEPRKVAEWLRERAYAKA